MCVCVCGCGCVGVRLHECMHVHVTAAKIYLTTVTRTKQRIQMQAHQHKLHDTATLQYIQFTFHFPFYQAAQPRESDSFSASSPFSPLFQETVQKTSFISQTQTAYCTVIHSHIECTFHISILLHVFIGPCKLMYSSRWRDNTVTLDEQFICFSKPLSLSSV